MVRQKQIRIGGALLGLCLALTVAPRAESAVTAQVDRSTVDLNESFMLEIIVDTHIDLEPDLEVLDADFYVGQVSQLSNTSIINGNVQRSRTWTIALMPKRTGTLEIPPIAVGSERSQPVSINVNEPSNAPPGEADVFITSEIDQAETYVQAQILYSIKVYRAVSTRQNALREPTIGGVEVLVELAGDERTYEAILNGRAYNVVERVIAIYPQESGQIDISGARFEARVLRNGRITGRKVFESEAHTVNVLPIPAPPADHPDAVWLPARDVQLSEEWSREPDRIDAGEPVTRNVTVSALGQIETQIPAIDPPQIDGMNVYSDKPELTRRIEPEGIRGIRKDQYAMIGVTGGDITVPELEVPWWDLDAGEWQVARLPARTIRVNAPEPLVTEAVPTEAAPAEAAPTDTQALPPLLPGGFWERASQVLAALWLMTLFAWWWSSREPRKKPREPEPPPLHRQQARLLKAARKAALAGDAGGVRTALLDWARLQWPDGSPRSIGDLATRVSSPLADELRQLSAASYGPGTADWDGATLARSLRTVTVVDNGDKRRSGDLLPPLMPPAA